MTPRKNASITLATFAGLASAGMSPRFRHFRTGNLALAAAMELKQVGELSLIQGIYALCPISRVSGR
jgi:hypothetical protein